jgi:hypothetical protein
MQVNVNTKYKILSIDDYIPILNKQYDYIKYLIISSKNEPSNTDSRYIRNIDTFITKFKRRTIQQDISHILHFKKTNQWSCAYISVIYGFLLSSPSNQSTAKNVDYKIKFLKKNY